MRGGVQSCKCFVILSLIPGGEGVENHCPCQALRAQPFPQTSLKTITTPQSRVRLLFFRSIPVCGVWRDGLGLWTPFSRSEGPRTEGPTCSGAGCQPLSLALLQEHNEFNSSMARSQTNTARIDGLRPGMVYVVQVRARTVAGYGKFSGKMCFQTLTDGKGQAGDLGSGQAEGGEEAPRRQWSQPICQLLTGFQWNCLIGPQEDLHSLGRASV